MAMANYDLKLEKGWRFHLGEPPHFAQLSLDQSHASCKAGGALNEINLFYDETKWQSVALPHDWQTDLSAVETENPAGGFKPRGTGWYHVTFTLPEDQIESARLVFEGVLGQSVVYVNGIVAVRNFSGYNRFDCEIGDYLLAGAENTIVLHVDASRWEGWWYEGAGLYRPVSIQFREFQRFDGPDCFIRARQEDGIWKAVADLRVLGLRNGSVNQKEDGELRVQARLEDALGQVLAAGEVSARECTHVEFAVENPRMWSPEEPYLYRMVCELQRHGRAERPAGAALLDQVSAAVGLRTIEWTGDRGMLLNGNPYPVKGICCHQDHAGVGAAVTPEIEEFRIRKLKELGANAYRCAHHAPTESLLALCDRLGLLVMSENRHFSVSPDVQNQLESMVRLSRNHPSVFLYSLFNEEPWQQEERGRRIACRMREMVLSLDDTRAVTAAQNGGMLEKSNASDALDVIGMNYNLAHYEASHERTPGKALLGTENCPTFATRGVYESDKEKQVFACYGEEWPHWFSESMEETMETMERLPYAAGCFAWCGFEHRGEPNPYGWPSLLSHWSVSDACGFPKDTFYELAAWYREDLVAHLMPHWNWENGKELRVCTFTNGETAELFLNGRSLGVQTVHRRRAQWQVPFEPGQLQVTVRRGREEVTDLVRTAGKPVELCLEEAFQGTQVRIINISVRDAEGIAVPEYEGRVTFDVSDNAILGVGNGDPNSHAPERADYVELFHGKAQLIVKGNGRIAANCQGLPETVLEACNE